MSYNILLSICVSIILLIFCFYNFYDINNEMFSMKNEKYMNYRLGDFIKGYLFKEQKYTHDYMLKMYPNSLCSKYYNIVKNYPKDKIWNNIEVISKLVDELEIKGPDKNTLVIHLRLGDAFLDYKNGNFIYRKSINKTLTYGTPLEKIEKIILEKKTDFKKITIVYGIHNGHQHDIRISEKYLDELRSIFLKNNIKFNERHNENPDLDFCYMCKSTMFIPSGSGFSRIVSSVIKYRNNNVYKV